jgi:hypothetical protein
VGLPDPRGKRECLRPLFNTDVMGREFVSVVNVRLLAKKMKLQAANRGIYIQL